MLNMENGPYVWKYWYLLIKCHRLSVSKDYLSIGASCCTNCLDILYYCYLSYFLNFFENVIDVVMMWYFIVKRASVWWLKQSWKYKR